MSIGGFRLIRNSFFNLIGQGAPLLAALVAIPLLIRGLGTDRFGVLTLAWMVIGYFSLFDLGLGRALTQVVAKRLTDRQDGRAPPVVWSAIAMMLVLGLLGTVVLSLISPWLVHSGIKIPAPLQAETLQSFYLLAAAIPIVVVTAGLVGILSAFQRFGMINAIRAPMGIFSFLAPLAILPFSQDLLLVTAALVLGRLLACGAYVIVCRPLMPLLRLGLVLHCATLRPLFHFGAWMTVSNLISPLMVYLDRFVIGAFISVAAVAYYTMPYEVVTKLLIVSGAIVGVLFPAFATSYKENRDRLVLLFTRGTKYVALILFPVILVITAFAHEGLRWWLGDEFAQHSTPVLRCLAIGVYINGIAYVFATLIQGIGRPDLSAKLHFLELPVYLLALWWAISNYGIVGAAIAWTGRVAVDGALLFWLSSRVLGGNSILFKRMTAGLFASVSGLAIPLLVENTTSKAIVVLVMLFAFAAISWLVVLAEDERAAIRYQLGRILP